MRYLLIALLLIGGFLVLRTLYRQSPRLMWQWLGIIAGAGLIVLVLTGRAHWIAAVVGGILPFLGKALVFLPKIGFTLMRWLPFIQIARRAFGGNTAQLRTAWLEVTINRATGQLDGIVLQGEFNGRRLSELNLEQLQRLLQACSSDPQSVALLRAYLQRSRPEWGSQSGNTSDRQETGNFESGTMAVETAAKILGVSPAATEDEVRTAHRHLTQKLHPDRGGNDYLTQKINQARDILLKTRPH